MKLNRKKLIIGWSLIIGIGLIFLFLYIFELRAPGNFPNPAIIEIQNGQGISSAANALQEQHAIRSTFWFKVFIVLTRSSRKVVGGTYYFEKPLNVFQIAERVAAGNYNTEQIKTTIPEGSSISDISEILSKNYPGFDTVYFLTLAKTKEGYLFPDTYMFGANPTSENIVNIMNANFDKKIAKPDIQAAITAYGKSLSDVIKMASILEGEARQSETRRIVAGILWKRISLGIPLQVDTAFRYVNGKTTSQLTSADLKIDSPYNTYIYKGLPPTPISNPGLDSILDAVTPIKTNYLYFLTDKKGNMHYAETLEQHVANKQKYLN